MHNSKQIAGLLGPSMVAVLASELPFVQPHLYDAQIPPVVYLSGAAFFVAGLAIVRAHSHWGRDWTVLVTLSGWFFLLLGVVRMFTASGYQREAANIGQGVFVVLELFLLAVGVFITYKGYSQDER
jgi:FtsH-binding integral membrane protein